MKRKILAISIVAAVIAIAVASSSLAWFMDEDETKNVFTVGSIDIEQNEIFDESTAQLIPVVGNDPTAANDNYIQKTVTVENVGRNAAYVQTYVAVPAVLDNNGVVRLYDGDLAAKGWSKLDGDAQADGIQPVAKDVSIDGETLLYNLYLYRYNTELAVDAETAACLEYVYIDPSIDLNVYDLKDAQGNPGSDGEGDTAYFVLSDGTEITEFDAAGQLNIYVATQGTQTVGFADLESALTTSFAAHPWAN